MEPLSVGLMMLLVLIIGVLLGIHLGIVFGICGFLGLWLGLGSYDRAVGLLTVTPYSVLSDFGLMVVPLLIFMGLLASEAGASKDAYEAANVWLNRLPGGLAMATIAANAGFAATTGSSAASAAVFTKMAMPPMLKMGYSQRLAIASVTAGSLLAMLIPPSIMMVVYSYLTGTSIARLFIAGVVPGLVLATCYCLGILFLVYRNPRLAPRPEVKVTWRERFFTLRKAWSLGILILVVLGGIWSGVFTPTEAGGVGAFAALVMALARRRLSARGLWNVIMDSGRTTAQIFFIFVGAQTFARMLAMTGVTEWFTNGVIAMNLSPMLLMAGFAFTFLVAGCFMDSISMILLLVPLMFPIVVHLGFHPIWFGIVVVLTTEIGGLTPPFGLNVFVAKAAIGDLMTLEEIFAGVLPFIGFAAIALAIIMIFPQLSLWLPALLHV